MKEMTLYITDDNKGFTDYQEALKYEKNNLKLKINKSQIIEAAHSVGFSGPISTNPDFNSSITIKCRCRPDSYFMPCGNIILHLLTKLGINVID